MITERADNHPRHRRIRQELADEIAAGVWQPGEPFPSEPQLVARFGVSRMTIRQALGDLVAQGLIVRQRGHVTRVAAPPVEQPLGRGQFYAFSSEMSRRGLEHRSRVLDLGLVKPSPAARDALGLAPADLAARITLLRFLGDEALMHERATFAPEYLPYLRDPATAERSLYEILEASAGLAVTRAIESIRPVALPRPIALALGVRERAPAFAVTRTSFARRDGAEYPLEWRESFVRGDRYRFVAALQRDTLTGEGA